ncbi:MAG TPA: prolipoprotein diacylglyceryl transferase [Oscillospiraceae bacterium]|nr:prolipoprotein diacylglyceryl transferase [Oscillospiraceae bacterium]HPS35361.1 prolipoprotein diacylglyceryl transferase [Oscillospiraceae bacterium]
MNDRYIIENIFGIEGWNIAWYGLILGIGIIAGFFVALFEVKRQKLNTDILFDFLLWGLPLAIIGARAYYVIFEWQQYQNNPISALYIWQGGLAIYGTVIGGFMAALIFTRINKFPLFRFTDIVVPGLVIGQVIGRWGNFVNQEAFGALITNPKLQFFPLAVYIGQLGEWHQATFFYESMWNLAVFAVLILTRKKAKFYGQLLAEYFIGYGLGRFWIEGLRTDSLYLFPGLRVSQALSLILAVVGILMFVFHKKLFPPKEYEGKYLSSVKRKT